MNTDSGAIRRVDSDAFPPTLGEVDLHLLGEGRHEELYDVLGAHVRELEGHRGTSFAVWAPGARSVSPVGDFNNWDGRVHQLRSLGSSGVWELFVPGIESGSRYKYEIRHENGPPRLKADPLASAAEQPPANASIVFHSQYEWNDAAWLEARESTEGWASPMSVYEVHLPAWRLNSLEDNRSLSYDELAAHVVGLGFTHVELLPVMEHPFSGSWGYQVSGYYAPTSRLGTPDDFRRLVDRLHQAGVGVILDWVPAHFPRDDWGPGVSRPTSSGGLGFGFKWNMGWMHDTLDYFKHAPSHRSDHHDRLTFGILYAFTESFVLPLSHDEVVHGKGSLLSKMPGDRPSQLANLRALYAYMWAHPGKKLLFMGAEIAQEQEWSAERSLDWHLLDHAGHAGVQRLVGDLNRLYRAEPALWERDFDPSGFRWLEAGDGAANVLAFARLSADGSRMLVCMCNFSDAHRTGYRVGLPRAGAWHEILNTDVERYAGWSAGRNEGFTAEELPWHGQPFSAELTLPPLSVVWLVPEGQ